MCVDLYLGLVAYTYIWEVERSRSQFHNHCEFPDTEQYRAVDGENKGQRHTRSKGVLSHFKNTGTVNCQSSQVHGASVSTVIPQEVNSFQSSSLLWAASWFPLLVKPQTSTVPCKDYGGNKSRSSSPLRLQTRQRSIQYFLQKWKRTSSLRYPNRVDECSSWNRNGPHWFMCLNAWHREWHGKCCSLVRGSMSQGHTLRSYMFKVCQCDTVSSAACGSRWRTLSFFSSTTSVCMLLLPDMMIIDWTSESIHKSAPIKCFPS